MANFYDVNGDILSTAEITTEELKRAFIGAVASGDIVVSNNVGVTLAYSSQGESWEANGVTAYQHLLAAYRQVPQSGIPFFITADQHGTGVEAHRWLNNLDVDGMNVLSINLGDTVTDTFNYAQLDSVLARTKQVKNFISVVGNHDKLTGSADGAAVANDYDLNRTFITTMPRVVNVGPMNCYSIIDGEHNVKILVVDTDILDDTGSLSQGLSSAAAEWLIGELSKTDGYDIVYLQHWPMCKSWRTRDEESERSTGTALENSSESSPKYKMWQMLLARKNRTSGTFEDANGVSHPFDFSSCQSDLLCTLHGHEHAERISTADGLTAYAAPKHPICVFGLIDRINSRITVWVFSSSEALEALEFGI